MEIKIIVLFGAVGLFNLIGKHIW